MTDILDSKKHEKIEKSPLFEKRLTISFKFMICAKKTNAVFISFCKKQTTAFRYAAVVTIAVERRTAAAQAQGARSSAVHSSVRMETLIRDKIRS